MTLNSTSLSKREKSGGFSLLEVLISIGLLAILSLAIYQTTSSSFDMNNRLANVSQDSTAILLSLQAVENDLAQIYSPMIGNIPRKVEDKTEEFWGPVARSDGYRRTRLKGSPEKLTFIANNNRRVEADTPQCDLQKITWEVDRNTNNTFSLYRSTDWDVFRYEEGTAKKPQRIPLIENLSNAKFSYYRKDTKAWEDKWDSEDIYQKEEQRFPDLIKIKIEAPDPTNVGNPLAWELVVRPNMALNFQDAKAKAAAKQRLD